MCNRVGKEDNITFIGQSIVVDPNGEVIIKADGKEQMVYADINLNESKIIRNLKPYFKLRRTEMYQ